jgi:peptidoglycan/LPS O-acetylase OafA/YrhL
VRETTATRETRSAPSPALEPPPGNPRFPLFDGLRGIAVLAVLTFHVSELTGRVGFGADGRAAEVLGSVGPILFFVISGFLLYRPFVAARHEGRPSPSVRRYLRRRALRIVPAYWVTLTLLAIYPGIVGVFGGSWWRYYGFLQAYSEHTQGGGIPVAWTLCVEVSFYLTLVPWTIAMKRGTVRVELAALALVAGLGVLIQLLAASRSVQELLASTILGQCTWLALGMALAVISASGVGRDAASHLASRAELCWVAALGAFVGLTALVPAGGLFGLIAEARTRQSLSTTLARIALTAMFCALVVLPAVFDQRRGLPRRVLGARALAGLGVISYSFYLWHLTLAEWVALPRFPSAFSSSGLNLLGHVHSARTGVLFGVAFAATAAVAAASYRVVELPFLRRKETQAQTQRAPILPVP